MRFDLPTMTAPLSTKPTLRFHVWLLLGALLVCIGGLGALAIRRSREPTPTLDEVRAWLVPRSSGERKYSSSAT